MSHTPQQVPVPVVSRKSPALRQPMKILKEMQQVLQARAVVAENLIKEYGDALKSSGEGGFQEEGEQASKEELTTLLELQTRNLSDIKDALLRIQHRTYGVCKQTKQLIPWERLVACPTATTCL